MRHVIWEGKIHVSSSMLVQRNEKSSSSYKAGIELFYKLHAASDPM